MIVTHNFECCVNRNNGNNFYWHATNFTNRNKVFCNIYIKVKIFMQLFEIVAVFITFLSTFCSSLALLNEPQAIRRFQTLWEGDINVCRRYNLEIPSNIDGGLRGLSLPLLLIFLSPVGQCFWQAPTYFVTYIIFGNIQIRLWHSLLFTVTISSVSEYTDLHFPTQQFVEILLIILLFHFRIINSVCTQNFPKN